MKNSHTRSLAPFSFRTLAVLALSLGALSACGPLPAVNRKDQLSMTRLEICQASCQRNQTICMEPSSTRFESYGEPRNIIGAGAACDTSYKSCMSSCNKR
jgi:hypothetical protein